MSAPFMQLYIADYMADTRHLTCEQDGAYMRLLMAMWRSGASLPADHAKLARIVGLTPSKWAKIRDDVMAFFDESDGVITQGRLSKEYKKAEEKSQKRSEAGKSGADAKALKNNNTAQAIADDLLKHSLEPEPEPEPYTVIETADGSAGECVVIDGLDWPADRRQWVDVLIAETGCADPARDIWPRSTVGVLAGWHEADRFEWQDVVTGIRAVMARKSTDPPKSWRYFSGAIARAKSDRTTQTPEAQPHERNHHNRPTTAERHQDSTVAAFRNVFGGVAAGQDEPGYAA